MIVSDMRVIVFAGFALLLLGCHPAPAQAAKVAPDASPSSGEPLQASDVATPPVADMVCDDQQIACACNDVLGCKSAKKICAQFTCQKDCGKKCCFGVGTGCEAPSEPEG